ncbi:MAG: VWA domain-containing protein [Flavobacteriales bacterium]|nr:VWA domain-containing protein [Flavobacteriales bacterium]
MRTSSFLRSIVIGLSLAWIVPLAAQTKPAEKRELTRLLFVMDASNSMNAFWDNQPKINAAREVLLRSLTEIEGQPDLEIALRLYGHQTRIEPGKQDCDDTKLEVPFSPNSVPAIRERMRTVQCLGTTPIARSLLKAADDFPPTLFNDTRKVRNIIILITDGIEACDEDPCAVSRALQAKGIILKPFVIGVGLVGDEKYSLECVGNYYDAGTPAMFDHVLRLVISQALNNTTTTLHLLDVNGKPKETNVPVTFYDQRTGQQRYNFVHTMSSKGEPDTLTIDPLFSYRVVAHTIPPSVRENVSVKAGQHNIITLDAGQGDLELRTESAWGSERGIPVIVRKDGLDATLHVQDLNSTERYRVGRYDLEVLTLPRLTIPDVDVKQSTVTTISVPQPGVVNIVPTAQGPGAIFLKDGSELKWVVDLDPTAARHQFRLLPGSYKVVYRSDSARQTIYSIEKDFTITGGQSITVNL